MHRRLLLPDIRKSKARYRMSGYFLCQWQIIFGEKYRYIPHLSLIFILRNKLQTNVHLRFISVRTFLACVYKELGSCVFGLISDLIKHRISCASSRLQFNMSHWIQWQYRLARLSHGQRLQGSKTFFQ